MIKDYLKLGIIFILLLITSLLKAENQNDKIVYTVEKGATLEIKILNGDIKLKTKDGDELIIYADVSDFDGLPINVNKTGKVYALTSKRGACDLEIVLPKYINIKIKSTTSNVELIGSLDGEFSVSAAAGDIRLGDIKGKVFINTGGGDIKAGSLTGEIEIKTFGGDIRIDNITSDKLIIVDTKGGDVRLGKINGECLISTAGGDITIDEVKKEGEIKTGGGSILVKNINGNYKIKTGGGDIEVKESKGNLKIETGSGNIKAKNVNGLINAKTFAGDIYTGFTTSNFNGSNIVTNIGDIYLYIPTNLNALVDVDIMSGRTFNNEKNIIDTDYEKYLVKKEIKGGNYYFTYKINGGNNKIYLKTVNGKVSIKKNKKY